MFTAYADKPTRMWTQLWMPVPTGNVYWRRSVYLDESPREITVRFTDMTPVGDAPPVPPLHDVQAVLFTIDRTNTALGDAGRIWIDEVRYAR
jgi:hypothetical protein